MELNRKNKSRSKAQTYSLGEYVYSNNFQASKQDDPWEGPYQIPALKANNERFITKYENKERLD